MEKTTSQNNDTNGLNFKAIRKNSILEASKSSYDINNDLPLLDDDLTCRPIEEIINRSLVLHTVIACSFGYKKKLALKLLKKNNLREFISKKELAFLKDRNNENFQFQIETLNTFAWMLGFVSEFNFSIICANNLITKFPDIKNNESPLSYIAACSLIDNKQILIMADLAYCLHNSIVNELLEGKNYRREIPPYVIIERRRALEWALSNDDWDDVNLET